jgi:hypothetical protein
MRLLCCAAAGLIALVVVAPFPAEEKKKDDGFKPMFNGKDLTGWVNVNCAPSTFFVNKEKGEIITTGKPTGFLRTAKQYENFIAEFDWMHVNKKEVGNSGFFVWADPLPAVGTGYTRGIEVQVLVNLTYKDKETGAITATSQGDLFSIWGATCKPDRPHPLGWARCLPSENRCKGGGEWNHYKVIGKDGVLKLHVNGKEVSGLSQCKPRKGYLALESEGAECHFRNLKIKELPSSNPKPEETADKDQGFKNLYTGLDLSGWRADESAKKHWQPRDWVLHYDGKGEGLRTKKEFGHNEIIVDFQFLKKDAKPCVFMLRTGEKDKEITLGLTPEGKFSLNGGEWYKTKVRDGARYKTKQIKPVGQWNRLRASRTRGSLLLFLNSKEDFLVLKLPSAADKGAFELRPGDEMNFGNLFVREVKE